MNPKSAIRNRKSGEIVTAVLVGLALGITAAVVHYNGYAQKRANETGMEFGATDYMAESPATAFGLPIGGALLGAGVGALIDGVSNSKSEDDSIRIEAGRDVQYVGRDGGNEQGDRPRTTTTTTTPAAPAGGAE